MKTRPIILILTACGCLVLCGPVARAAEKSAADLAIKDLKAASEKDKLKSLDELADLGPGGSGEMKYVEGLLKDSSPSVRAHAAYTLGAIGAAAKDEAPELAEMLKDSDLNVRRSAFHAIRQIHPGPKVMIPLCTKMLEESGPMLRGRLLSAIADAGPAAVPELIVALKDEKAKFWALIILRDIGPAAKDAVPAIVETLKDKRSEIRREAVLTLGAMGDAAVPAAPEIAKLLGDENAACAATFVLAEMGQIPKESEETIRNNSKSDKALLSTISLWALARVHPEDKELRRQATEKLVERLKDKDGFVRAAAARALAALPPAPEITAPIFEKAMKDADETTIRAALGALAALGPKAVPRLMEGLKFEKFRPEIIYTLGKIGPDAAPATDALAKLVDDKDSRVANEAIIALGNIGPAAKAAVPALVKVLSPAEDRDMNFAAAAYALGKIGPEAKTAEPVLLEKLSNKDGNVRVMCAWALAEIDGTSPDIAAKTVPVLIGGLSLSDNGDQVLAAQALGVFGPLAKAAADALKKAATNADKNLDDAAAAALKAVEKAVEKVAAPVVAAILYKPGDQVVTADDKIEIGKAGSQGQIVPKGTKLKILEIRGTWIGVQGEADGKTFKGWVLAEQIGKP